MVRVFFCRTWCNPAVLFQGSTIFREREVKNEIVGDETSVKQLLKLSDSTYTELYDSFYGPPVGN